MVTLNRALLKASPFYEEEFLTANYPKPGKWDERPRPAGKTLRTKLYHSGAAPVSRGLGTNGSTTTSESQVYSNYGYAPNGVTVRSPFALANDAMLITASPATQAEADAVDASCGPASYAYRRRPKYVSGMMMTDPLGFGYTEVRMRRPLTAKGDFPAFWMMSLPGANHQEIDFEWVDGEPGYVFTNVLSDNDEWGGKRSSQYVAGNFGAGQKFTNDSSVYHTYGVFRSFETIEFYIDETRVRTIVNSNGANGAGCHHPMCAIVDLAKDGEWNYNKGNVGAGTETSSLEIDFIKHWDLL